MSVIVVCLGFKGNHVVDNFDRLWT